MAVVRRFTYRGHTVHISAVYQYTAFNRQGVLVSIDDPDEASDRPEAAEMAAMDHIDLMLSKRGTEYRKEEQNDTTI